jgi:hypothetical protein
LARLFFYKILQNDASERNPSALLSNLTMCAERRFSFRHFRLLSCASCGPFWSFFLRGDFSLVHHWYGEVLLLLKRIVIFVVVALFALCAPALALIGEEVGKDFQPVSGYVITTMQGEYLIDLDASQRLAIGDIFAVVQAGEKIVHPVTKKVIGTMEKAKAYLQVTRIQSGYSYSRLLGGNKGAKIVPGDVVRRFQNLPALFWDYSGRGEATFAELQTALPHLEWADYASAQAARPPVPAPPADQRIALTFIYDGSRLEARDPYFRVIHTYGTAAAPATAGQAVPATPLVTSRGMKLQPVPAPLPVYSAPVPQPQMGVASPRLATSPSSVPYKLDQQPFPASTAGGPVRYQPGAAVSYKASFPGFQNVGTLPPGILHSDFVVDGGRRLMVATNRDNIYVFDLSNGVQRIAHASLPYSCQLLSVNWWKPSASEPLHVAVTGWITKELLIKQPWGDTLGSVVFVLEGNALRVLKDKIRYTLGTLDRDGDGLPELLLAQSFERRTFLGRTIKRCVLQGGKLELVDPGIPLPGDFSVIASRYVDVTGDGQLEIAFVRNNILYIYSPDGKRRIYESAKEVGGSQARARYEVHATGEFDDVLDYFSFELTPVAADLDGDRVPELVVPSVEKLAFGIAEGVTRGVSKSWLGVIKFRDGMFIKGTIGEKMDIPLAGLTVTPNEVLFVATEATKFFGKKGQSYLLSFPLK